MTTDVLDELIREALNAPLGDEAAPEWEDILRRAAAPDPVSVPRVGKRRLLARLPAGKRGWLFRSLALATIVGATTALLLLFVPGQQPDLLKNAAAAMDGLGSGPVLHLVYASPPVDVNRLNVNTGAVTTERVPTRFEVWYDRARGIFKQIYHSPVGSFVNWKSPEEAIDSVQGRQPAGAIQIPPEVSLFSHYRQALAKRQATVTGEGTVYGHQVFFLEIWHCVLIPFPGHPGSSLGCSDRSIFETIAIDKHSYLPVSVYPGERGAITGPGIRITKIDRLSRRAADLSKPPLPEPIVHDHFGRPQVTASKPLTASTAASWVGRQPLGLRTSLAALPLAVVLGDRLSPGGAPVRHGLELIYGRSCQNKPRYHSSYLLIREAPTQEPAYDTNGNIGIPASPGWVLLAQGQSSYPECHAPKINFYSGQDKSEQVWVAVVHSHGLYASIASPSRALVAQAVHELLAR